MDTPPGQSIAIDLPDPGATREFASGMVDVLEPGTVVYLKGTLGTGKTTFVRMFMEAAGYRGRIRSPTYTLVEVYPGVAHFDLYRLSDPEELEWLGGRDYFGGDTLCFIEWPEKGTGYLPPADLIFDLEVRGTGRRLVMTACTGRGHRILQKMKRGSSISRPPF